MRSLTMLAAALLAISGFASAFPSPAELGIETITAMTCSRSTKAGDTIHVHYRGTLQSDGSEFDSSYKSDVPFTFKLGVGQVIKGWDEGLLNMCIGERRILTIPPDMAYGDRGVGPIPGGSTLIFETWLVDIDGVEPEASATLETTTEDKEETQKAEDAPGNIHDRPQPSAELSTNGTDKGPHDGPKDGPKDGQGDSECRLLGPFALLVQGALGALALLSLVFKRYRETPRRPLKIWWFDASKQVFGSVLLHLANLFMSMLSSGELSVNAKTPVLGTESAQQPNPCSFYLLNLAIDTTVGIPILIVILRLLHRVALLTPLASPPESIKSGNYGHPPRVTWWLKQSIIYFIGLMGMKFCVFILFAVLPWIAWVGDWALRWTEGNEALQITFVMFVFPLIMNAMQYYIIDSFIKDPAHGAGDSAEHQPLATEDEDSDDEHGERRGMLRRSESAEFYDRRGSDRRKTKQREVVKEANLTAVPVGRNDEYDPSLDGEASSGSSSRIEEPKSNLK